MKMSYVIFVVTLTLLSGVGWARVWAGRHDVRPQTSKLGAQPAAEATLTVDVETINIVNRLLESEISKYRPGSPESVALWRFKERLNGEAR